MDCSKERKKKLSNKEVLFFLNLSLGDTFKKERILHKVDFYDYYLYILNFFFTTATASF